MRLVSIICISAFFLFGCKKKNNPLPPEGSVLVFPDKNSECTTGVELSSTTSEVEFRWQPADHTDRYELRATNLSANTTQRITTAATAAKLPLQKGVPYSWNVTSISDAVLESVASETWLFYNSGSQTTYAPFPAEIIAPAIGTSVFKDENNEVTLQWSGADVDNDIVGFEIYFSTQNPPEALLVSPSATVSNTNVTVAANMVYYWSVVTIDGAGNKSSSGVFDFRAL